MLILLFALFVATLPDRPTEEEVAKAALVAKIRAESRLDGIGATPMTCNYRLINGQVSC